MANLDDPNLHEQVQAFFALNYLENIESRSRREKEKAVAPAKPIRDAATGAGAQVDKGLQIALSTDDYPEEAVDQKSVEGLLALYYQTRVAYTRPFEKAETPEEAACVLLERFLLNLSQNYLLRVVLCLAADRTYHLESPHRIDAAGLFDFASEDMVSLLEDLPLFLALGNVLFPELPRNAAFAAPLAMFEHVVALFFDVLDQVFPLKAIGRCRRAYDLLFLRLGEKEAIAEIPNLLRRHKTMFREILNYRAQGGQISTPSSETIDTRLAKMEHGIGQIAARSSETLTAVKGVDRRQRDLLAFLRKSVGGFVELFRPKPKPVEPSREAVAAALLPQPHDDRYACLQRIAEPHRSQVKAVIDHTFEHPIVYDSKNKSDFTLADAARAVFQKNEAVWEKIPGSFPTWQHLKSSCYNLQGKPNDPFRYQR